MNYWEARYKTLFTRVERMQREIAVAEKHSEKVASRHAYRDARATLDFILDRDQSQNKFCENSGTRRVQAG